VFGGLNTYLEKGDKQLIVSYRGFRSTKHFQGKKPFPALDANGPENIQNAVSFDLTYALNQKWNLSVNVPVYFNEFNVMRVLPGSPNRVEIPTESRGIGDISVKARYWTLPTENGDRNIGLSVSIKAPTGKADRTDQIPGGREVPVDTSVQTGDGSWGITPGIQAFQRIKRVTLFGAAQYLINPRNMTGTPSFFGSLTNPKNTQLNSSADQYYAQFGGSVSLKPKWPVPSLGYRFSGVPVKDLIGKSDGFRRPGTFGYIEPGVNVALGKQIFSFTVSIRNYVNVKDSPYTTRVEDATIPKYMFSAAYSIRF
jgi:hypothetical protein